MGGFVKSRVDSFVDGTNDREAHRKYWIAALVQMNTELKVSTKLNNIGIANYVPIQNEIHQWSDRKKKIKRVVIPMIVFVRVDDDELKNLRTFPFIHKLLSYPGEKQPAQIPDGQIDKLMFMLNNADSSILMSDSIYEIGEEVEIIRGPLKGLCGEMCSFEEDRQMVGIRIELLGYACVNVNRNDIERKINNK